LFNAGNVFLLEFFKVLLGGLSRAPPEVVVDECGRAAVVVHLLVYQIRVKEDKEDWR
jgi:hypothetical protein